MISHRRRKENYELMSSVYSYRSHIEGVKTNCYTRYDIDCRYDIDLDISSSRSPSNTNIKMPYG